jgi:hypothetical protein
MDALLGMSDLMQELRNMRQTLEKRQNHLESGTFNWRFTSIATAQAAFFQHLVCCLATDPGSSVPDILAIMNEAQELCRDFHVSSDAAKGREDSARALGVGLGRMYRNAPGSLHSVLQDLKESVTSLVADLVKVDRGVTTSQASSRRSNERECGGHSDRSGSNSYRERPPPLAPAPVLTLESLRGLLAPAAAPSRTSYGTTRKCTHCNMDGHTHETCFQLHPEQRPHKPP